MNIVYGGHVHNAFDLEAMESAAKEFLSRELPLWFCEDNILADMINSPGNFGKKIFLCTLYVHLTRSKCPADTQNI